MDIKRQTHELIDDLPDSDLGGTLLINSNCVHPSSAASPTRQRVALSRLRS
jgi:hypothetical protein